MNKPKQTTVAEALRWSDKHRKLSDNEGVRVVHIQQLLQQELDSLAQEVEELKEWRHLDCKSSSSDKDLTHCQCGYRDRNYTVDQVLQLIRERGNK